MTCHCLNRYVTFVCEIEQAYTKVVTFKCCFQITQGLQTEFNRLYVMFCTRHPYFEANGGKVSILAHSLGRSLHNFLGQIFTSEIKQVSICTIGISQE